MWESPALAKPNLAFPPCVWGGSTSLFLTRVSLILQVRLEEGLLSSALVPIFIVSATFSLVLHGQLGGSVSAGASICTFCMGK